MPNKGKASYGKSKRARGVVHFTGHFELGTVTDSRSSRRATVCRRCGKRLTAPKTISRGYCRKCLATNDSTAAELSLPVTK